MNYDVACSRSERLQTFEALGGFWIQKAILSMILGNGHLKQWTLELSGKGGWGGVLQHGGASKMTRLDYATGFAWTFPCSSVLACVTNIPIQQPYHIPKGTTLESGRSRQELLQTPFWKPRARLPSRCPDPEGPQRSQSRTLGGPKCMPRLWSHIPAYEVCIIIRGPHIL